MACAYPLTVHTAGRVLVGGEDTDYRAASEHEVRSYAEKQGFQRSLLPQEGHGLVVGRDGVEERRADRSGG